MTKLLKLPVPELSVDAKNLICAFRNARRHIGLPTAVILYISASHISHMRICRNTLLCCKYIIVQIFALVNAKICTMMQ